MDSHEGSRKKRGAAKRNGLAPLMMRRCQECQRAGAARSHAVDLCEECDATIAAEVHERVQAIKGALRKLKTEASVGAKLGQWDLILAQAEALLRYEEREILTTCPPPSTLLQDFRALRGEVSGAG